MANPLLARAASAAAGIGVCGAYHYYISGTPAGAHLRHADGSFRTKEFAENAVFAVVIIAAVSRPPLSRTAMPLLAAAGAGFVVRDMYINNKGQ